jgi:hydrogenase maturation factor
MGAEPVGVLVTLLYPEQAVPEDVARTMADVDRAARDLRIEVLGGHTEVTLGLAAPIIAMAAIGRAPRTRVLSAAGARPGQALVLTKAAGLEGSAILAHDLASALAGRVPAEVLERARRFTELVSVVPEGLLAARAGATAMHDPTEGGVLGALWELAEASGVGFVVHEAAVPVRAETRALCAALGVDPLKLISSGALLIACPDGAAMVAALAAAGIPAAVIGEVTERERILVRPGGAEPAGPVWRDELWRVLEGEWGAER